MQRFLTILLICFLVYLLFNNLRISLFKTKKEKYANKNYKTGRTIDKGMMVKCRSCSSYFPLTAAILKKQGGETLYFCSKGCFKDSQNPGK